ncbi:MAG: type IV pilus twitching motility protein PilT [bacterium]|nr:type IV pilus twitching motility protein PilT [bacterium]MBK7045892.1 type IV pilus twitching motility protein PilT [bacterium]MBK7187912.1 type IV pilus twitching motility protein PilT [bacterium]MBK7671524.1 type IV pilus twitching motility protein PilT [bacterium]MBK7770579.1 type IV pilus twitching motility protein PilT [bacterium]
MDIKRILKEMISRGASDLHLKVASPPVFRINGTLVFGDYEAPTVQDMAAVCQQILAPNQRELFEATKEIDFAFGVPGVARFRANFYVQRGSVAMVFRHVPVEIHTPDDLHLPPVVKELAMKSRGLMLVTGTVGSGKSTTLASIVDIINREASRHVITIEDPIEFLHRDRKSIISQREIGCDTTSYADALKHVLRQDPDVILIGEIRDAESMKIAITAADTGHLVLSTMHTIDATQTISRIISFFPPHQHQEIRYLLASTLQAVISQRLVADADGLRRFPACEILIATGTIREYIREPEKTVMIRQAIQEGFIQYQMQTFDQSLMQLYKENRITIETALQASSNPHEFMLRVKGIQASSDNTWQRFENKDADDGKPAMTRT